MSVQFSYYMQTLVLAWIGGNAMPSAPARTYFALLTVEPNADGTGVIEPTGGYARQPVMWNAPSSSLDVTSSTNATAMVFGPATANWATVTYAAIFDAISGGNLIAYGPLPAARVAPSGDTISFGIDQVQLRLE